jgi:hypothetical protein
MNGFDDAAARAPLAAPRCPLCGEANACAPARTGSFDTPCWCTNAVIDPAVIAVIPDDARGRACVCARCASGRSR